MTWPVAIVLCVAMPCFTAWLWFRAERKKQFETMRAEHRAELEKLHANLKEVANKVVSLGNQVAFAPKR